MANKKTNILRSHLFVRQFLEATKNGERFCFILGAGASVESGIPSGNVLGMRWMNYLMGEADDMGIPAMDPSEAEALGAELKEEEQIEHSFEALEAAWLEAKSNKSSTMPSDYYFDIYKLRFYPSPSNGHRYLERIMEKCEPSLGYHTLALLLASNTLNNLVITTNFDSLVEDALFLYTDKKPLVVSHESLTQYIESDIQRPIIAKVHRGLMFGPLNSTDATSELKEEWREALLYAFNTYTPIVIGYGGGDRSLMSFLEEKTTTMRKGIYWCYHEPSGLPEEKIQSFVTEKNGYFVPIGGFDALMMEIGKYLYQDKITPTGTAAYLEQQYKKRCQKYNEQWDNLNKKPELQNVLQPLNKAEQAEEKKREENDALTAWDYIRRGLRASDEGDYENAIKEYERAIEIDPYSEAAYNNRGVSYWFLGRYEKAIDDCTIAIRLDSEFVDSYYNRGTAYYALKQYEKAIEDYTKAIELDPEYVDAYHNRGEVYNHLGEYEKAIEDCTIAIEKDHKDAEAYYNRGEAYNHLSKHEEAIKDCSKAIQLDPKYKKAYLHRAMAFRIIGEDALAEADEKMAETLT